MSSGYDARIKTVTIVSANVAYQYKFSADTKKIQFQNRGDNDVKFAVDPNQVVSGVYYTLKGGQTYFQENLKTNTIFYFAGTAGDKLEILLWL